jgi:hypothetical protein
VAQYADIIEIVTPGEAQAGSRVDVTVRVKNIHTSSIGIKVVGVPEYEGLPPGLYIDFPVPSANVSPGVTYSFSGYFTMPDRKVTVHIYSYWYGADSRWYLDDQMTKVVDLAAVVSSQFGFLEIVSYTRRL